MSETYLYLSLVPECLVASMRPPEDFGHYLAVGNNSASRGQALFFEVDSSFTSDKFPMHLVKEECVTRPDGKPKNSVYLSVYRALEHIPISALGRLFLTTDDGKVLALEKKTWKKETDRTLHLYQEFCPVNPCIASTLDPDEFSKFMTAPDARVHLPRLVFSELIIRDLATDPKNGKVGELPYAQIDHLRNCLALIKEDPDKQNKMVFRRLHQDFFFRTIRTGFFVGDQDNLAYYPMPSEKELNDKHYQWWKSALVTQSI